MAGSDVVSPDGSVVLCVCQCVCDHRIHMSRKLPEPIESFPIGGVIKRSSHCRIHCIAESTLREWTAFKVANCPCVSI